MNYLDAIIGQSEFSKLLRGACGRLIGGAFLIGTSITVIGLPAAADILNQEPNLHVPLRLLAVTGCILCTTAILKFLQLRNLAAPKASAEI